MSSSLTRDRLELAVRHHRAGRLREAVEIYQDLLRTTPNDADLMQRLGVALAQGGRPEEGVQLMFASLELKPDRPQVLLKPGPCTARSGASRGRSALLQSGDRTRKL